MIYPRLKTHGGLFYCNCLFLFLEKGKGLKGEGGRHLVASLLFRWHTYMQNGAILGKVSNSNWNWKLNSLQYQKRNPELDDCNCNFSRQVLNRYVDTLSNVFLEVSPHFCPSTAVTWTLPELMNSFGTYESRTDNNLFLRAVAGSFRTMPP